MKIVITEEQKKKLFIPRKLDERDKIFFKEIKFTPILDVLKNGGTLLFEMSTPYYSWDWDVVLCELSDGNGNDINLPNMFSPVKDLLIRIVNETDEGVIVIKGGMEVNDNKLEIEYTVDKVITGSGMKTYNL